MYLPHYAAVTTDWIGIPIFCRVAIETEIAEEAEISIQTIRVALDAEIAKGGKWLSRRSCPSKNRPNKKSVVTMAGIR